LKADYFDDALYGIRQKVIIKYSLFDLSYIKVYTLSGKFLCKALRSTLTHPLVYHTGEIKDIEDYKQKIQKQKYLKNKTIKAAKEFLNIDDLKFLECEMLKEEPESIIEIAPKTIQISKKEKYNPYLKPLFKNNFERYEYLMNHGCISNEDRNWLAEYKNSKEFKEYEKDFC